MATRIIKKGTARASAAKPFSFSENVSAVNEPGEIPEWTDFPSLPVSASGAEASAPEASDDPVDLAALEKAAYEKGLRQGEKAGIEEAERALEPAARRYAASVRELEGLRASLYAQAEREVVRLAIAIAEKIVRREVRLDPEIVQPLVHVALGRAAGKSPVTLCVHPDDYRTLLPGSAELSQSEGRDVALVADRTVERGGCLIRTDCGDIDARIEEQFRELERAFFEGA